MDWSRSDTERLLAVFVGFLSMITSGSTYAFGAFTNAVKSHFNYTQSEVEFLSSMPNIGISFAFPAGIIIEKFGPRWSTLCGAIFSSLGYGLLYSTTLQQHFYHTKAWLQCVYFFIAGFGATFFYMTPLAINMGNFHPKHRGKVVGVMDASFSAGPAIFAAIYGTLFVKGHVNDEENQDLKGFYFLNIICSVAVGALALIFIKRISYEFDMEVTCIVDSDLNSEPVLPKYENISHREISGLKLLNRFDFHYLSWASRSEDCNNIFVCSSCTASKQHKGHNFVEVTEVYKTKKEVLKKDIKELENHISPSYEKITLELEQTLANLDVGYEKLTETMSKQGEEWHREIDIVINKMKTEISKIKVQHREILQKHLNEIKQIQSVIKQSLLAIREVEKSTEVSPTIEYSSKIREFSKLPSKVQVSLPTFIPKPIDREKLYSLFGQFTPLSTATEKNVSSLNQPKTSVRELQDEPVLVTTIQTGYKYLRSVICVNEDRIWTCGQTNEIKCLNIKGSLQTIHTISGGCPIDIAVDSDGHLLYSEWETRTVYKVKNRQTEELIRLQGWRPYMLCVTSTGDLLLTMYCDDETQSKVVRYSGSSKKQTIQFDDEGKLLYSGNSYSKYITENRNHDVCVADNEAGAVVVVNQDGKLRWRYTGHPSVTKNKPFKPQGITTDSQSHILTADYNNYCVHILDQNGLFLRYIDNCDLKYPYGLCVDNNDNLFVCEFYKGNVKKIKYLS